MVYKGKMVFRNVLVVWNKIWKFWVEVEKLVMESLKRR